MIKPCLLWLTSYTYINTRKKKERHFNRQWVYVKEIEILVMDREEDITENWKQKQQKDGEETGIYKKERRRNRHIKRIVRNV